MVDSAVKYYKRGSGNNPATLAHYSTLPRKWIIGLYGLRGLLTAFRQAHADSVAWWYQPHVKVIETPLAILDAIRVKRHFFGYLLALSTVYLLCTPSAPLVANLICLVYPIASSLRVIRGQSGNAHRLLLYWLFFAWMSLFDYYAHTSNIFCFARIFVFLIQYILPVSQGVSSANKVYYELFSL